MPIAMRRRALQPPTKNHAPLPSVAGVNSVAHIHTAVPSVSDTPILILPAPYASTRRVPMMVATAAAQCEGRCRCRRQGGKSNQAAKQDAREHFHLVLPGSVLSVPTQMYHMSCFATSALLLDTTLSRREVESMTSETRSRLRRDFLTERYEGRGRGDYHRAAFGLRRASADLGLAAHMRLGRFPTEAIAEQASVGSWR